MEKETVSELLLHLIAAHLIACAIKNYFLHTQYAVPHMECTVLYNEGVQCLRNETFSDKASDHKKHQNQKNPGGCQS